MKLGIIGAGKVGIAMGLYFKSNGVELFGYYSRTLASAEQASRMTDSQYYHRIDLLLNKVDTIAITTPDDQIDQVVTEMNQLDCSWKGKNIFNMSGAVSSLVLEPLAKKGATVFSLHPMMTILSTTTIAELSLAYFTFEGKGSNIPIIEDYLNQWKLNWLRIRSEDKHLYHAAATIVSNYLVAIMDLGYGIFKQIGIEEEQARALYKPLVDRTIANIWNFGTEKALTGPISRGDLDTVKLHLQALATKSSEWENIYRVLGVQTLNLARRGERVGQETYQKIKEELEQ